jgi:hypothetical protein
MLDGRYMIIMKAREHVRKAGVESGDVRIAMCLQYAGLCEAIGMSASGLALARALLQNARGRNPLHVQVLGWGRASIPKGFGWSQNVITVDKSLRAAQQYS